MVLNSSRLMPRLSRSYCGMVLYFANSACQSAAPSGGTTPVTGFHSTIESPDSVSRVAPPTKTMAAISAATASSQARMARAEACGAEACVVGMVIIPRKLAGQNLNDFDLLLLFVLPL